MMKYHKDIISIPRRHSKVFNQTHAPYRSMTEKDGESDREPDSGAVCYLN